MKSSLFGVRLESAAGQEDPCMPLHVSRLQKRWGPSGSSSRHSLGLYDKKQLYMQGSVLTLSLKCALRHVWGHIFYDLWRLIWLLCNTLKGAPTGSTVLYLSSSVLQIEFCAILHQFPIGCISAQNYLSAHATAHFCTCCTQKAQCTTVFMALPLSCEQSSEYSCKWGGEKEQANNFQR